MSLSLDSAGPDVIGLIGAHLHQTDFIRLSTVCRKIRSYHQYPDNVSFSGTCVQSFMEWIGQRRIRSLRIHVNPLVWNELAPRYLTGMRFDKISIFPDVLENMNVAVWIPACNELECGFVQGKMMVVVTETRVFFKNFEKEAAQIPHLELTSYIRSVHCDGSSFLGLRHIPPTVNIHVNCILTEDDVSHLTTFPTFVDLSADIPAVRIRRTAYIPATRTPRTFRARKLRARLESLPMITAPWCKHLIIILSGDVSLLSSVKCFRSFLQLESVSFEGFIHDWQQLFTLSHQVFRHIPQTIDVIRIDP